MTHNHKNPLCETCRMRSKGLFANLEHNHLSTVSTGKSCNLYRKGNNIFHENNHPLGLYAIYSGKVKVYKTSETGREHILRLAREGEPLGYRSLISGESYEASAMALEDSRICFIPKDLFLQTLGNSNNLTGKVMQMLTSDLRLAEHKITNLAQKSVRERVAETILMLKQFYGMETDNSTINVSLSREDLANLVGTATETLIRSLSEFKQHKILETKGKKIIIRKFKVLERMANNFD